VEVYLPLRTASGELVMVEAYHPGGRLDAASRRIWRTFLPMLLAVLVALAVAQLPLVWVQGRRARADAREREVLAREAEQTLQDERGRIATELHEGVVQDLAGAAYALHAAATLPDGASERDLRGALGHGAEVCRNSMTRMRELLVDLRASEDRVQDLHGAMDALAQPLRESGVEVIVGLAVERSLPGDTALLMHLAAREILLDVRRHADASLVTVGLVGHGPEVILTVDHNQLAGADGDRAKRSADPRTRLDSLADRLATQGGSLAIDTRSGRGVRYTATLPAG
jgi:signal transduction histidine kinase